MRVSSMLLAAFVFALVVSHQAFAQDDGMHAIEITDTSGNQQTYWRNSNSPIVGRKAAAKYMAKRNPNGEVQVVGEAPPHADHEEQTDSGVGDSHYLAVHIGGYVSDTAYKWGSPGTQKDVGGLNLGVTYRLGEWVRTADFAMRVDYSRYNVANQNASKLAFLPVILFPDAASKFPLYFGVGAGLGVFLNQLGGESALSFDYQLLLGARFFDLVNNAGLFIEAGIKNHLNLLSDGQFNGTFVAVGGVFTF